MSGKFTSENYLVNIFTGKKEKPVSEIGVSS